MTAVVEELLSQICSEGASRLFLELQRRYNVVDAPPRMMAVTRRELGQIANDLALWNFIVIANPSGDFIAERALDGGLRLPAIPYEVERSWDWSNWPALVQFLSANVQRNLGLQLLAPEPVARFAMTFTTGSQTRHTQALVWLAQSSGRLWPNSGLTATVVSQPQQLDLEHDQQLATSALDVVRRRPAFPVQELDAAAAVERRGVIGYGKRIARSLLRRTPQPQRTWVFEQLKELGVGAHSRVLDLACGDDTLASEIRTCFGAHVAVNDLLLSNVAGNISRDPRLELFNHDLRAFPVSATFDVVILKNVLHHLRAARDHYQLHAVLKRIARTALIVEIADPNASAYYRWLHDHVYTDDAAADGRAFLNASTLTQIVSSMSPGGATTVREVFTARGSYLLAKVDL